MDFGFFKGLPYEGSTENFDDYKRFKNDIPKDKVIEHINSVELGLTTLPSKDFFTGEELHAVCSGTEISRSLTSSSTTTRTTTSVFRRNTRNT